jgi:hypothetical protein
MSAQSLLAEKSISNFISVPSAVQACCTILEMYQQNFVDAIDPIDQWLGKI